MSAWGRQLAFAFRFFTRFPRPFKLKLAPGDIASSARWFPLVGFFEGVTLLAALFWVSQFVDDDYILALFCTVIRHLISRRQLTGAGQTMGGLLSSRDRVKAVKIMLDPGLNGPGFATKLLDIMLRYVLYQQLFFSLSATAAFPVLLVSCMAGKCAISVAIGTSNSVFKRDRLIDDSSFSAAVLAAVSTALLSLVLLGLPAMGLTLVLEISLGLLVSGAVILRLGGLTKQVLNLVHEIGEIAFLFTMLIW